MAYQVLARKWRPQRFSEVVGQEHITRTLQNAILQNRVGHAYLFVGPRGTGKTTTARIFAKALNCVQGIVAEPCCECLNCRELARVEHVYADALRGTVAIPMMLSMMAGPIGEFVKTSAEKMLAKA